MLNSSSKKPGFLYTFTMGNDMDGHEEKRINTTLSAILEPLKKVPNTTKALVFGHMALAVQNQLEKLEAEGEMNLATAEFLRLGYMIILRRIIIAEFDFDPADSDESIGQILERYLDDNTSTK